MRRETKPWKKEFELWAARDVHNGIVYLFDERPYCTPFDMWVTSENDYVMRLPHTDLPDLTFANSPRLVRLTIVDEHVFLHSEDSCED